MTLQSLADEIKATKQRLAGDYRQLKASTATTQEAAFVWDALQIAAKKEILLMVCRQPNDGSVSRALGATLSYRGCKLDEWTGFLSLLQENLDDSAKCAIGCFLSQSRKPLLHPTLRERFWADLLTNMSKAEGNLAQQQLIWDSYCADKAVYFTPPGMELKNSVYSGFLAAQFDAAAGLSAWGSRASTRVGSTVGVTAWFSPNQLADTYAEHVTCWQGNLVREMTVRFSIDDSELIRATPRTREVSFAVWQESPRVTFEIIAPKKPGLHTVWVEVFENNCKLSSLPLDLEVVE